MATHTMAAPQAVKRNKPPVTRRAKTFVWYAFIISILLLVLYPLFWMVGSSFKAQNEIVNNISMIPKTFTPKNYSDGWNHLDVSLGFGRFFLNSAMLATIVVIGNCLSCLVTAYAFARLKFRGRGIWFTLMITTLLLPHHVLIIPQFILFKQLGWVGGSFPYLPLIVPHLLACDAFFVFLMVQFIRGIPRDLDEAAKIDGCSVYGVFRHVILPLSKPVLVTSAIFSFIWTWNDFFRQLVYLSEPEKQTVPVALRMFIESTGQSAVGPMFAMAVLSLAPVFVFFVAFQRLLVEGMSTSGLKG
jgi:multiple sugar transport system permease protein